VAQLGRKATLVCRWFSLVASRSALLAVSKRGVDLRRLECEISPEALRNATQLALRNLGPINTGQSASGVWLMG
jgi:hypothetical protein